MFFILSAVFILSWRGFSATEAVETKTEQTTQTPTATAMVFPMVSFGNAFAPLIDYYVVRANIRRRALRHA